jgi:tetratricopeptide (TPR) repeat protein
MDTSHASWEVLVMVKRWLHIHVVVALVFCAGTVLAGPDETATSPEFSRGPSLDALKRGFVATDNGDHEAAYGHYRTALEKASDSELRFQAYFALGSTASALGRYEEAKGYLNEALAIKPDSATVVYSLGLVAKEIDGFQQAASLFTRASVLDPKLVEAQVELGIVYEILGMHTEAAEACWRAVELRPDEERALLCLGVARYHLELYEGAAQAFEAVIEQNPGSAHAHYSLGLCRLYLEDRDGAMNEYRALRSLDEDMARDLFSRINPPEE